MSNSLRIVTRPDFDGIVCAVLLRRALNLTNEIKWMEPHEIQSGEAKIMEGDIISNLPYSPECSFWFDHHVSNTPDYSIEGAFDIAPSAAGVVYKYYKDNNLLDNYYDELVLNTDIIDSADLDMDMVRFPENYPYIILSMTIHNQNYVDIPYWNKLVDLLMDQNIDTVLMDPEIKERCNQVIAENKAFETHLKTHTKVMNGISITDFRSLDVVPSGNRFLTYSIFPQTHASVKIRFDTPEKQHVLLSIGHSIFNTHCRINAGNLLAKFGGGGHAGAGGCTLDTNKADQAIEQILHTLFENKDEG